MESHAGSDAGDLLSNIDFLISTISLQQSGLEKYVFFVQKKLFSVKASSLGLLESRRVGDDIVSPLIQVQQSLSAVSVAHSTLPSNYSPEESWVENKRLLESAYEFLDVVEKQLTLEQQNFAYWQNFVKPATTSHNLHSVLDDVPKMFPPVPSQAHPVIDFLISTNCLTVVGIVGEGGIGKTTLLVRMLQTLQLQQSFSFVVFIELVSDEPDDQALMHAQASMLLQLGGPVIKFEGLHYGRVALKERLQDIVAMGMSFCIAIDNVWRTQDLKKLLSDTLVSSASSSIMITSRICSVVDDLEDLCARNVPSIPFQLMVFEEQPLHLYAAKSLLLAQCSYISKKGFVIEHETMLSELCTFCGGNPLVLKVAGGFLASANCDVWERCMSMMEEASWITDNEIQLRGIFEISYKNLHSSSKEALCDIASFLHKWKWDAVENIVGFGAMKELTSFHLIKCVDQEPSTSKLYDVDTIDLENGSVIMHEFMRKLVLKKTTNNRAIQDLSTLFSLDVSSLPNVKFLHLDVKMEGEQIGAPMLPVSGSFFAVLERLTVLELSGSLQCGELLLPQCLVYLKLANDNITRQLSNVQVPCSLRHFELERYEELLELPMSIYKCRNLQILRIYGCPVLHGFISVSSWQCLRKLHLQACYGITQLPEVLEDLELLSLHDCIHLQALPPLPSKVRVNIHGCPHLSDSSEVITNTISIEDWKSSSKIEEIDPRGTPIDRLGTSSGLEDLPTNHSCGRIQKLSSALVQLRLLNCICRKLGGLGLEEMKSLRKLKFEFCSNLVRLPNSICNLSSLVVLDVRGCSVLEHLPQEVGQLSALKNLDVYDCPKLKRLPKSISGLKTLAELNLIGCFDLEELPEEIGLLSSLRVLRLAECPKLRGLPNRICKLNSLSQLELSGCKNLEGLPKKIGSLGSLQTLLLMECPSIKTLPNSVCKLSSLSALCLSACVHLEALPKKVGSLSNLTMFGLAECLNLTKLCKSICNLMLLTVLDLQGCLDLVGLPEDFGSNLAALETLYLMECKKFKSLPNSFCRLKSLKELDMSGCLKLERMPDNFGELSSLQKLRLSYCRVLKQLPESICQLQSLVVLDLHGCYMLEKLPKDLGSLDTLEELILVECATLEVLPRSASNLKSLRELDMRGSRAEKVLGAKGQLYFVGGERVKSFLMFGLKLNG